MNTRVSIFLLAVFQLIQPVVSRAADSKPADYKLEFHLIWGTNAEKPEDPRLKDLDDSLRNTVTALKNFKWKNYWEVSRKTFIVPAGKTNHVVVSKLCELDVKHLDGENFEVMLYGEKKLVHHRMRESLAKGRALVLAGDDKNDSAWFVVIMLSQPVSTTQNPKPAKPPIEAGKTNKPAADSSKPNTASAEVAKTNKSASEASQK